MNEEQETNAKNCEQPNNQEEQTKQQNISLNPISNLENERKIKIIPLVNKQPVTNTIKLTNESRPVESRSSLPTTKLITLTNSAGSGLLSSSKLSSTSGIQYVKVVNTSSLNKNAATSDLTRPQTTTLSLPSSSTVKLQSVNSNTSTNNSILADALNVLAKNTTGAQSASMASSTSTPTTTTKYQIVNPTATKLNQALNQTDSQNPLRTLNSASPATSAFSQCIVSTASSGSNSTTTTTTSVTKIILNTSTIKPNVPLTKVNLTPVVNQQQAQTANMASNYRILSQQINSKSPTVKPIIPTIASTTPTTSSTGLKTSTSNNQILVTKPLNEEKKPQLAVSLTPIASSNSKQQLSNTTTTTTTVLKSNSSITNTTSAFQKPQFQSKSITITAATNTTPLISKVNKSTNLTEPTLSATLSQFPTSNSMHSTIPLTNTSNIALSNSNSTTSTTTNSNVASSSSNNRKPCNCTKSMCLKL